MTEVVIVEAVRTAVGRLGGSLKDFPEDQLGALVVGEVLARAGVKGSEVDEVIMGYQHRSGDVVFNAARQWSLKAGLPEEVPNFTINKHCGSSLKSINLGAQAIRAGDAEAVLCGGVNIMSRAAYLLRGARWGWGRPGNQQIMDQLVLLDPISGFVMGETGDNVAKRFGITREDQDKWALVSQQRTAKAMKEGRFKGQIVPVPLPGRKGEPVMFEADEHPRAETTLEGLAKLKPIFLKDGTVTAGNACGMNDAAAAVLLMSGEKARSLGVKPYARIVSYASAGVEPAIMGVGPVPATRKALGRAGMSIEQMDVIEFNEAFASQTLYCMRELGMDTEKVNPNGGAIALGHPIAATGSVLMTKLVHEMRSRKLRYGLATMCMGGGLGIATIVEGMDS